MCLCALDSNVWESHQRERVVMSGRARMMSLVSHKFPLPSWCAGQLYLDREDFDEAKEYINKVLQLAPAQHDSYALLLKAVLNLKTGQFHVDKHTAKGGDARGRGDPKAAETLQKIHDCFFKALQHFNAVLRKDEHNIYAANGVAAVLAEKGNLVQAREIFTMVCSC